MTPPPEAASEVLPANDATARRSRWPAVVWTGAIVLFVIAGLAPVPPGLTRSGALALAAVGAAVAFWASGVQDPAMTGLLIVSVLALLRVVSFEQAVAGFGAEFVWLLAATFILAQGMADSGLGRRIALGMLRLAGGRASLVLLALLGVVVVLSFMVPTAAGRISMVLPICLGIAQAAGIAPPSNFARAMLIGTSHTTIMAGIGVVTGAGATVYAAGAFANLAGHRWTYLGWMAAFFPPVVGFVLVLWRLLLRVFPPERDDLTGGAAYVRDELRRLGALGATERKMLAVFAGMYVLWIVGPRWQITTAQAGLLGALTLVLPGMRVLSWERALGAVKWNVVILFAVSLTLARALESSGAGAWLAASALGLLARPSPAAVLAVLAPLIVLLRVGFVNNLGMIALGLPLAFALARGWGLDPVWVGLIVVMTAGPGFLLPTQTPTGMITIGYEYYTTRDYLRSGLPASLALLVLVAVCALAYWPLLGWRP
ncbi:MAG: DASS family sodium-coupled anion symporter [Armatimonadota bacterium]|nr:DASS family sodium-coupled anion symporter [Armatimonadota bacterium]MDR7486451.1 DASS family sodium-coupled anion symporter [Armatimonadota bacterium]MDR7532217.1 DASS family sodium-coupled anion symporter [Armatimonadota bacterium]MDR7537208.1 DASS family sodium-coupled anion symporter [Armatimonadota bacterium]